MTQKLKRQQQHPARQKSRLKKQKVTTIISEYQKVSETKSTAEAKLET